MPPPSYSVFRQLKSLENFTVKNIGEELDKLYPYLLQYGYNPVGSWNHHGGALKGFYQTSGDEYIRDLTSWHYAKSPDMKEVSRKTVYCRLGDQYSSGSCVCPKGYFIEDMYIRTTLRTWHWWSWKTFVLDFGDGLRAP